MKNINKLQNKLQKLNSQKKSFSSLESMSIPQFIKYKHILSTEKTIKTQMTKMENIGSGINFWYDSVTNSWIENPKINCLKYEKLEKMAAYTRDKTLYQLGLSLYKPIPVLLQKPYKKLHPAYTLVKSKLHKAVQNSAKNFNYFKSYLLPKTLNNIAISSAKQCIKGYRNLKNNLSFFKVRMSKKSTLQYLNIIKNEALRQLDGNTNSFKESLKVNIPYQSFQNHPSANTVNLRKSNNKSSSVLMPSLEIR